jgi:hypothetical protein
MAAVGLPWEAQLLLLLQLLLWAVCKTGVPMFWSILDVTGPTKKRISYVLGRQ